MDGILPVEEFERQLPDFKLHPPNYETVAGFIVKHVEHVPQEGETFRLYGYHVEVINMGGRGQAPANSR